MRRDQLEHAIRTACQIIQQPEVIVVGSQAILGTYDESQLPTAATMSIEVDILPIADSNDETARLADLIEGVAGEFSTFEDLHGFSIDGVDLETAVLTDGWRDRLVKVQNSNTAAPDGEPRFTACASTRKTCASPSLSRSARRTATSSPRCSRPISSMPTSSHRGYGRSRVNTSPQARPRSRGSAQRIEPSSNVAERCGLPWTDFGRLRGVIAPTIKRAPS